MDFKVEDEDQGGINEINITPFVDVVLVLLVIFMVTTPMMVKTAMDLTLPSAENTDQIEQKTLGVTILKSGNVMLNGVLISPDDLKTEIQKSIKVNAETQVIMIADKMATHGMVIEVIDLVKGAGAKNFAFQVEKKVKK
jgi:biopolymer transport protein TolR